MSCVTPPPDKTGQNFSSPAFDPTNLPKIGTSLTYTCITGNFFDYDRTVTSLQITCLENDTYSVPGKKGPIQPVKKLLPKNL